MRLVLLLVLAACALSCEVSAAPPVYLARPNAPITGLPEVESRSMAPSVTSTLVTLWTATRASSSTLSSLRPLSEEASQLAIQAGPGCLVLLSYATGDVDQVGDCDLKEAALVFWSGVNRYNPALVGSQYRARVDANQFLLTTNTRLEERRQDLIKQVELLTDALQVLKRDLEAVSASKARSP